MTHRHALLVVALAVFVGVLALRQDTVMTQPAQGAPTDPSGLPWEGVDVPGTGLRVWTQGAPQDLQK